MSAEACLDLDADTLDEEFKGLTPRERIARSGELFGGRLILPTSFGKTSPFLLKHVAEIIPDITVVTIRHGYESPRTLELAGWYERELDLDLRVYEAPRLPVPEEGTPEFAEFQRRVKVEPFQQALDDLLPRAYFSGRMRHQSLGRAGLPFVEDRGSVLAINPIADVSGQAVETFLAETGLPVDDAYFDPAKGMGQDLECRLNTSTYG